MIKKIISKLIKFLLPHSAGIGVRIKTHDWKEAKGVWYVVYPLWKGEIIYVKSIR